MKNNFYNKPFFLDIGPTLNTYLERCLKYAELTKKLKELEETIEIYKSSVLSLEWADCENEKYIKDNYKFYFSEQINKLVREC